MTDQISIFDSELPEGTVAKTHGRELSFDEAAKRIGDIIILDKSTEHNEWFMAVRLEKAITRASTGTRRLICFDGTRHRQLLDEFYFRPNYSGRFPIRVFEVSQ